MNQYDAWPVWQHCLIFVVWWVSRYLTQISIGVIVVGIVLVALGPGRDGIRSMAPLSAGIADPARQAKARDANSDAVENQNVARIDRQLIPFTIIPNRPRNTVLGYTVETGDTIFGIASRFAIKPETLLWSNQDVLHDNVDLLLPGANLAILPVDGVYATADGARSLQSIADDNGGDVGAVIGSVYNQLTGYKPADVPPWGMRIVIPGGHRSIVSWMPPITTVTVTSSNGTSRVFTGFMQGMSGSCTPGIAGGGGSGQWLVPIQSGSYTITQPFASWHSGIDMAANIGETVRAADTGVVVFAGWNDYGYGDLVVLDHGNGWTTYYAHLNSFAARCGATIQRGQALGGVGATGKVTGPHLHFEMRWFHTPDNPASYIGF